jgi:hypothetical protein
MGIGAARDHLPPNSLRGEGELMKPERTKSPMKKKAREAREENLPVRGQMLMYSTEDGRQHIEVRLENETVWMSQANMARLFQTTPQNITLHIGSIYEEGELAVSATCKEYLQVQQEGVRQVQRLLKHYNLEMILAVGYRVRSHRGTQFRQWATERLREYIVKGFVLDDERLKNPPGPGVPDYFDEMLERIRDIRSSERRMYLQVRNILALAADYDPGDEETQHFFQIAQNKLHFAATGLTAPELIARRADHTKPNMGLTAWKGSVVRKGDVTIAKNYLNEKEIGELNRIVTMFLDFAEDQARRRRQVFMRDWRERLDDFLRFNERNVLPGAGQVSREAADQQAIGQYGLFHQRRLAQADAKAEEDSMKQLEQLAKTLRPKSAEKGSRK